MHWRMPSWARGTHVGGLGSLGKAPEKAQSHEEEHQPVTIPPHMAGSHPRSRESLRRHARGAGVRDGRAPPRGVGHRAHRTRDDLPGPRHARPVDDGGSCRKVRPRNAAERSRVPPLLRMAHPQGSRDPISRFEAGCLHRRKRAQCGGYPHRLECVRTEPCARPHSLRARVVPPPPPEEGAAVPGGARRGGTRWAGRACARSVAARSPTSGRPRHATGAPCSPQAR